MWRGQENDALGKGVKRPPTNGFAFAERIDRRTAIHFLSSAPTPHTEKNLHEHAAIAS